jgi:hypothetical protein
MSLLPAEVYYVLRLHGRLDRLSDFRAAGQTAISDLHVGQMINCADNGPACGLPSQGPSRQTSDFYRAETVAGADFCKMDRR